MTDTKVLEATDSASNPRAARLRTINGAPPPSLVVRSLKGLLLALCCGVIVLPFVAVISTSVAPKDQVDAAGGYVLWPDGPNLDAFRAIFAGGIVTRALMVSVGITLVGTLISITSIVLLAYSLSRPGTFAHKPILFTVLFTMLFAPGMIPMYLTIQALGLLNSYWSLILPTAVTAFEVIIVRAFFLEIPQELYDAARIDGASELQTLRRVVLPLSKAVIAVVGLFKAVAFWNAFFNALLYIQDADKWPLQLVLRTYVVDNSKINVDPSQIAGDVIPPAQSLQMAILVISIVPIAIVYPFLQRHFAKGIYIGAVKG